MLYERWFVCCDTKRHRKLGVEPRSSPCGKSCLFPETAGSFTLSPPLSAILNQDMGDLFRDNLGGKGQFLEQKQTFVPLSLEPLLVLDP